MKKFPGAQFIERVIDLFREEQNTSPPSKKDGTESEQDQKYSEDAFPPGSNFSKGRPYGKAYESNIDRYKHPSDLYRPGI